MIHIYRKKLAQWAAELDQARERGNFALARKAQEIVPEMKKLAATNEVIVDLEELRRSH